MIIAQNKTPLGPIINQGGEGMGAFANLADIQNPAVATAKIVSIILGFLTIVAGLWFLTNFLLGAVSWISAGGDKGKAQQARDKLTNAVIGLAIVVGSYAIAGLLGSILGVNFLDIGSALLTITGGGTPVAPPGTTP